MHVMNDFCRLRQCRRRLRVCSGPMQPSPHQIWKGHAQKEIGLSGKACADLPICMAHQRPEYYQIYRQAMEEVQDMQQEHADIDLLYAFVRAAAKRRPRRPALLTSNPYHPTSSGETKG
ncbi:hypothetical protein [Rhizobium sp. LCM 4573]|uniref:hypothetical protein n=1 Tax=Rhizobium sp. LCM 4573 TaxID=1848291 RepID=UPI0010421120|nr:hypothetical protein [Rhizobium sp. LCM 4573]